MPQIHSVYDVNEEKDKAEKQRQKAEATRAARQPRSRVVDMNKSYESLPSNEDDERHYAIDSDGEPPRDQVGDKLTIVKKQQVTKTILQPGDRSSTKPGKPYIVKVTLLGYFAPVHPKVGEFAIN